MGGEVQGAEGEHRASRRGGGREHVPSRARHLLPRGASNARRPDVEDPAKYVIRSGLLKGCRDRSVLHQDLPSLRAFSCEQLGAPERALPLAIVNSIPYVLDDAVQENLRELLETTVVGRFGD